MKIVIEIDENVFTRLFDNGIKDYGIVNDDLFAIAKAIRKGAPLSETTLETEIRTEESAEYFKKSEVLEMLEKINKAVEYGEGYQYKEWVDYVEELSTYSAEQTDLSEIKALLYNIISMMSVEDVKLYSDSKAEIQITPKADKTYDWCKGCKEYDTESHCCHRYSSFIRESLQENINAVLEDIKAEIDKQTEIHADGEFYIKNIDVKRILKQWKEPQDES